MLRLIGMQGMSDTNSGIMLTQAISSFSLTVMRGGLFRPPSPLTFVIILQAELEDGALLSGDTILIQIHAID